ncbi:MAG: type I-E CRISPR-associated protein Cas6/Cse3/CasE [Burkholderiales bacterium]|nr:type I-E CRISPR-associated protein Cas6/Cse3/CasE [Burkholderiales bacterium]
MLHEYEISKPASLRGYPLHRIVAELTKNEPSLFSDEGATILVRTESSIDAEPRPVKELRAGQLTAFELRACVSKKRKGKHIYPPTGDWESRHEWLQNKASAHGFEILSLHSSSKMVRITDQNRSFKIDQTDFTGVLKVTDESLFRAILIRGVGSTAKTFGFGMLVI